MDLGGLLSITLWLDSSLSLKNGSCDPQLLKIIRQITAIIHLTAIPKESLAGKPLEEVTFKCFTKRLIR
ncbi:MAG: hypothetical protein KAI93_09210, partial [Desulfobacterales bacterium]|jgi:hypothetical protein|nr:hypothetical protein [Desulfobacterales bacterium]